MGNDSDWRWWVTNRHTPGPPVLYRIGNVAWMESGPHPDNYGLKVQLVQGLDECRFAYSGLPGLGGERKLAFTTSHLMGPRRIAEDAAHLQLRLHALETERAALARELSGDPNISVGDYVRGQPCGREIMNLARIASHEAFAHGWKRLAAAAHDFVKERWPQMDLVHISELRVFKVRSRYEEDLPAGAEPVPPSEARKILLYAERWSNCCPKWPSDVYGPDTPSALWADLIKEGDVRWP